MKEKKLRLLLEIMKKNRKYLKEGMPPGSLIYGGEHTPEPTQIDIITYNASTFEIQPLEFIQNQIISIPKDMVLWINIRGLADIEKIQHICDQFKLHPLVAEDILSTTQRPKVEDYDDYMFIVLKHIEYFEDSRNYQEQDISIVLGQNYVISVQEASMPLFTPITDRIVTPKGRIRHFSADYLAYSLLDVIIDSHFSSIEGIGNWISELEEQVINNPQPETLQDIYNLKRKIIRYRKSIWPLREVINKLQREETPLISSNLQLYLRDLYDHIYRLNDSLENYRDLIFGMLDMYLSSVSYKMNDIMKILTIISTIFIPLTFLAGIYGMNFHYMPELTFRYGYPILIGVMVGISIGLIFYFKKKRWI